MITAMPPSAQADAGTYEVRRGGTRGRIAREHGLTVAELQALNGLAPGQTTIHVGQELVVAVASPGATATAAGPAPAVKGAQTEPSNPVRHVVRPGETLTRIARRYGLGLPALMSANGLNERSIIRSGQVLQILGQRG